MPTSNTPCPHTELENAHCYTCSGLLPSIAPTRRKPATAR